MATLVIAIHEVYAGNCAVPAVTVTFENFDETDAVTYVDAIANIARHFGIDRYVWSLVSYE
jgi:hypothetical protein